MPYFILFDSAVFFFNTIDRDRIKGLAPRVLNLKNSNRIFVNFQGITKIDHAIIPAIISPLANMFLIIYFRYIPPVQIKTNQNNSPF